MEKNKYIGIDEVAEWLNISKTTARNWCAQGLLAHFMVNGRYLVLKESVYALAAKAIGLQDAERNIEAAREEQAKIKKELDEQIAVMKEELLDRKWVNNHLIYVSEMFALMISTLKEDEDSEMNARLVKYFLDGDNYNDIALLTGLPLYQVKCAIRSFGRKMLRTRTYAALCKEVKTLRDERVSVESVKQENVLLTKKLEKMVQDMEVIKSQLNNMTTKKRGRMVMKEMEDMTVGHENILNDIYFSEVADFEFSARLRNVFRKNNIRTFGQVVDMGREKFSRLRNVGALTVAEMESFLEKHNLKLK